MPTWNEIQQKIASSKYSEVAGIISDIRLDDPNLDSVIAGLSREEGDTLRKIFESGRLMWFGDNNLMARLILENRWILIQKLQPALSKIIEQPEKPIFSDALMVAATEFARGGLPGRSMNREIRAACISLLSVTGLSMHKRGKDPFPIDREHDNYHLDILELFAFAGDAELYGLARDKGAVVATELGFRNISRMEVGSLSGTALSLAIHNKQWGMLKNLLQSRWSGDCLTHFGEIAYAAARLLPLDKGVTLFRAVIEAKKPSGDSVHDSTKQYYSKVVEALIYYNQMDFLKEFMALTGHRLEMVRGFVKDAIAFSGKKESAEYAELREVISEGVKGVVQQVVWMAMGEVLSKNPRVVDLTGKALTQFTENLDRLLEEHLGKLNAEWTAVKEACIQEFLSSLGQAKTLAATHFEQVISSGEVLTTRLFAPVAGLISAAFFDEGLKDFLPRITVLDQLAQRWLVEKRNQIAAQAPDQIVLQAQKELLSFVMAIAAHQKGLGVDAVIAFLPAVLNMPNQNTTRSKKAKVDSELKEQSNEYLFAQVVKTVVSAVVQLEVQRYGYCHPRVAVVAAREVVMKINQEAGLGIDSEQLERWLTNGFSDRNLGSALKSTLQQGSLFANVEFGAVTVPEVSNLSFGL